MNKSPYIYQTSFWFQNLQNNYCCVLYLDSFMIRHIASESQYHLLIYPTATP